jgi:hypothetical protein
MRTHQGLSNFREQLPQDVTKGVNGLLEGEFLKCNIHVVQKMFKLRVCHVSVFKASFADDLKGNAIHFIGQIKGCTSGRRKTLAHQNDIAWTLFDPVSTTFIHF